MAWCCGGCDSRPACSRLGAQCWSGAHVADGGTPSGDRKLSGTRGRLAGGSASAAADAGMCAALMWRDWLFAGWSGAVGHAVCSDAVC